jgi:hypothetical protein
VLSALGATDLLQGIYVVEKQLKVGSDGSLEFFDDELRARFHEAIDRLANSLKALTPVG